MGTRNILILLSSEQYEMETCVSILAVLKHALK